jgi:molybdopterin-guanine dinucleotide biosynthesis protein A
VSPPAGLILAGGSGSRLGGVAKAGLRVGGVALVQRAAAALGACRPVLLAHGRIAPERIGLSGLVLLPDGPPPPEGPLAGLAAAAAWLAAHRPGTEAILSLAVDTPFFPADFAERARARHPGAPAVVAAFAGQAYPTNALWQLAPLLEALREAPNSLARLAERMGAPHLDWAGTAAENPFANVNTLAELLAANRRARRAEADAPQGNFGLGKAGQSR